MVPTGTANTASVLAALRRVGMEPVIAQDADAVAEVDRVVLPGVGSFGAAGGTVASLGMTDALVSRIGQGRPTLAVCVGMQLLARYSDESPGSEGLGIIDSKVGRFSGSVRVPQLGWNQVVPDTGSRYLTPGWAYFANSFRIDTVPDGWVGATTNYGGTFVSAMERGDVLACQFHPELSGAWGLELLERWVN